MNSTTQISPRPPSYPYDLERQFVLADGRKLYVRPVLPDDVTMLEEAIRTADPETLYWRFFTSSPRLDADRLRYLTDVDYQSRLALIAFDEEGTGVAVARYEGRPGSTEAEVAYTVREGWRRLGVSRVLHGVLEEAAVARGIDRFVALYLAENHPAAEMLARFGFGNRHADTGVVTVTKDLHPAAG